MKRAVIAALALAFVSCGELTRQGTASSYLMITRLGPEGSTTSADLESDVVTNSSVAGDVAVVAFALGLKDPGGVETPTAPTSNNFITVDRYRVRYIRSDGRNTPGVDVPYAFDGAVTVTVRDNAVTTFTIVRAQAKVEAPLGALASNPLIISTIAEVTFYGHDQTGREVQVTGRMGIHFGNFADPASSGGSTGS